MYGSSNNKTNLNISGNVKVKSHIHHHHSNYFLNNNNSINNCSSCSSSYNNSSTISNKNSNKDVTTLAKVQNPQWTRQESITNQSAETFRGQVMYITKTL